MHDDSDIKKAIAEYEALKIVMQGLKNSEHDLPDALLERESLLISRLCLSSASSGSELAYKAVVLRDLVEADDLIGSLTISLCRDAIRLFPINPMFSNRHLRSQKELDEPMSSLSCEDLLKLARLFTN
jgi:hypothetical protein